MRLASTRGSPGTSEKVSGPRSGGGQWQQKSVFSGHRATTPLSRTTCSSAAKLLPSSTDRASSLATGGDPHAGVGKREEQRNDKSSLSPFISWSQQRAPPAPAQAAHSVSEMCPPLLRRRCCGACPAELGDPPGLCASASYERLTARVTWIQAPSSDRPAAMMHRHRQPLLAHLLQRCEIALTALTQVQQHPGILLGRALGSGAAGLAEWDAGDKVCGHTVHVGLSIILHRSQLSEGITDDSRNDRPHRGAHATQKSATETCP